MVSKKLENNEIEKLENVVKHKNISAKKLLLIECIICFTALAVFLSLTMIAAYCKISDVLRSVLILVGVVNLVINCFVEIYIEVNAGYHVCSKCGHKHQPSYFKSLIAPQVGWTRYMKCPKCGETSWHKKKFTDD